VPCVDWEKETPLGRDSDEDITLLAELTAGSLPGESSSSGLQGIQFAAVGGRAYELAAARGLGKPLDIHLFLQDIAS
ncbi:MAG: hypothetical protein ACREP8_09995, partial [Candidatus Binatia bacterium]